MVLLAVAALYRKARAEKYLGNVWKGRVIKHCLRNMCLYGLLKQNGVVCLSFDTQSLVVFYQIASLLDMFEDSQTFCKHRYFYAYSFLIYIN